MRRATIILPLALLTLALCEGCNSRAPAECRRLCALPVERQRQSFKSLPAEKQVDLYVVCRHEKSCWRDSVSPQDDYGRWMAEDGNAAKSLTERLAAEKDEGVRRDIVRVLRSMAVNGHLKGQRRIAEAVNRAVAEVEEDDDERVREQTETWAKEVEENTR